MASLSQKRAAEAAAETQAAAVAEKQRKAEYFITDPNMKNIGNVRLKPGQTSVVLTADEARLFLGQGLDTVSPEERAKQRAEEEEKHEEHLAAHEKAEAKRIEAAEANARKAKDGATSRKVDAAPDTAGDGREPGSATSAALGTVAPPNQAAKPKPAGR